MFSLVYSHIYSNIPCSLISFHIFLMKTNQNAPGNLVIEWLQFYLSCVTSLLAFFSDSVRLLLLMESMRFGLQPQSRKRLIALKRYYGT